jgi:DNA-binding LytR/AlgR family response regulator
MATILIVEDEALIAGEITRSLVRLGHTPLESVDNSDEAIETLLQQPVELVLMDINIAGDMDGIAAALLIRRQFAVPVMFLTARTDSATINRAKVAQPYGYVVKPFTDESLRAQLEFALHNAYHTPPPRLAKPDELPAGQPAALPALDYSRALFVRKGAGYVKVAVDDILYFDSLQNYVRLHTAKEVFVFDSTLKELEQTLPSFFLKTHRCYIANLNHVSAYEDSSVLIGKEYIPVSRSCKEELKTRIHLVG